MEIGKLNLLNFDLFFLFCSAVSSISGSHADCIYTAYIQTGSVWKDGTDSVISLTLYNSDDYKIRINDLEAWGGLMGQGYNYFERGNLDIFSGRGPCLDVPVCTLNLTSDGSGPHHGWYCNYVEVIVAGVHRTCNQHAALQQKLIDCEKSKITSSNPSTNGPNSID